MSRRKNKDTDVFKLIDMSGGSDSCWPFKGRLNSEGRPYFTADGVKQLAYRLVYELVTGNSTQGQIIRHSCDNPVCCNPSHLELGSHQENMNDMKERERHGLPHHAIRAIRKLGAIQGLSHQSIADRFGIGRSTVTEIISGVHYSHVEDEDVQD